MKNKKNIWLLASVLLLPGGLQAFRMI